MNSPCSDVMHVGYLQSSLSIVFIISFARLYIQTFFSYSSCYTCDSLLTFLISFSSWHTYYFLTIHLRVHIFKIFCQLSLLLQLPSVLFNFALHKKRPYSALFWSLFSRIRTEYAEIRSISPCLVRMRENMD